MTQTLIVKKTDLGSIEVRSSASALSLESGQTLLQVETFALTTNNITYAHAGDKLGYWNFYPVDDDYGCVPVWGFARVIASESDQLEIGERIFGLLPMASQFVVEPGGVTALSFSDQSPHRGQLHPWYNRYFRCANDPVFDEARCHIQPVLWGLFMTGWRFAEIASSDSDAVIISSASSKTALAIAWSLRHINPDIKRIAITSGGNRSFVEARGVYDEILTYDDVAPHSTIEKATFVDVAGNAAIRSQVHVALGDRLHASYTLGATHRAPPNDALPMPGPTPEFFFIPAVAEDLAAKHGFDQAHGTFAKAWTEFAPWADQWLQIDRAKGIEAIASGYRDVFAGGLSPNSAKLLTWT